MTRSIAVRILALAAVIGLLGQALLLGSLLGLNVLILTAAALAAALAVRPSDRRIDPLDRWLPPAALALAVAIAIRADPVLLLLDAATACALLGASVAAIGGEAVTRRSAVRVVELGFLVIGWTAVGILRVIAVARRPGPTREDGPGRRLARIPDAARPVVRGLLIAAPLLVVFGALFAAADAAFARIASGLLSWNIDLGELPGRLFVAAMIAWAAAGLLIVGAGAIGDESQDIVGRVVAPGGGPVPQSLGAAAASQAAGPLGRASLRLGAIEATTILVAIDILFALFVLVQLAYLFGGQDTLAATGMPYAQYARSGFFELVWVAVLAGGALATVHAVLTERTAAFVWAGLVLCGLTGVILASALLRLRIYQDAYGWTELRFYVLAAIVWLAAGIVLTGVLLARSRMGWLGHGLGLAALIVLIGVNVVGPSRLIAEQNVARVLDPSLVPADGRSGLDVSYAVRLGDDAIPALVAALPALEGADRAELLRRLRQRRTELFAPIATGWPSWNLGREAARVALANLPAR